VLSLEDRQSFSDISIIIKMMSPYMQSRISDKFIQFIEENKDKSYQSLIDNTLPLESQELSPNTKTVLALIYRDYLCSEDERQNFILKQFEKQKRIEEEKKAKYEINFKNNQNTNQDLTSIIEYKKINIFTKLLNALKKFFLS